MRFQCSGGPDGLETDKLDPEWRASNRGLGVGLGAKHGRDQRRQSQSEPQDTFQRMVTIKRLEHLKPIYLRKTIKPLGVFCFVFN